MMRMSLINPEAQEVCDEIDNDCDGNIDDNSDLNTPIWYADIDSDGLVVQRMPMEMVKKTTSTKMVYQTTHFEPAFSPWAMSTIF